MSGFISRLFILVLGKWLAKQRHIKWLAEQTLKPGVANRGFAGQAKNGTIALATVSIFNDEIGSINNKITDNLKQNWYKRKRRYRIVQYLLFRMSSNDI